MIKAPYTIPVIKMDFLTILLRMQGKASKEIMRQLLDTSEEDFDEARLELLTEGLIKKSRGSSGHIEFTAKGREIAVENAK